jgi:hypothetical protein
MSYLKQYLIRLQCLSCCCPGKGSYEIEKTLNDNIQQQKKVNWIGDGSRVTILPTPMSQERPLAIS